MHCRNGKKPLLILNKTTFCNVITVSCFVLLLSYCKSDEVLPKDVYLNRCGFVIPKANQHSLWIAELERRDREPYIFRNIRSVVSLFYRLIRWL